MFVSTAYAQAAGGAGGAAGFESFIPLILIFVVFYFLLIRPQQKKAKQHKEVLSSIKRGDKIVTGGGIIGEVTKATEGNDELTVEIAEGVKVKVDRRMVASMVDKTAPATQAGGNDNAEDKPKKGGLRGLLGGK